MLERALTYCLQEETHFSFGDLMDIQPNEPKQPKVQAQTVKFDVQQLKQQFIKKSSLKDLIQQTNQDLKQRMKLVYDYSPYESEWQKNILNKYYKQNQGNNSFCNSIYKNTIETRRRAFSIQMNSKKVNLRIRDMSMFTERKQSLDQKNQF